MAPLTLAAPETPGAAPTERDQPAARADGARRARALEALAQAIAESSNMAIPPPVTQTTAETGSRPLLPPEAFELARQVYYLQHGTFSACANAVIAAGLADGATPALVVGRLRTWWRRQGWPKRSHAAMLALRDANFDGGMIRSERLCAGRTTGNGRAAKGEKCTHSAMRDSDYCPHHDPRPEYVQARRVHAARLAQRRAFGLVPIEPLQRWLEAERQRLLARAQAAGRAHPNNKGWGLLARSIGVDQSLLTRIMTGRHSGAATRAGKRSNVIRAATVVSHLEGSGVQFRDLYGFDAPQPTDPLVCPRCGQEKAARSAICRACYDLRGSRCTYVNRRGRRCPKRTSHPSGVCHCCRTVTERVRKPRWRRPSNLTPAMLTIATGEHRDLPDLAWVAKRMWETNAAGVRGTYKSRKTLREGLVKHFRRHGWISAADSESTHARLLAEHGPMAWSGDARRAKRDARTGGHAPARR